MGRVGKMTVLGVYLSKRPQEIALETYCVLRV